MALAAGTWTPPPGEKRANTTYARSAPNAPLILATTSSHRPELPNRRRFAQTTWRTSTDWWESFNQAMRDHYASRAGEYTASRPSKGGHAGNGWSLANAALFAFHYHDRHLGWILDTGEPHPLETLTLDLADPATQLLHFTASLPPDTTWDFPHPLFAYQVNPRRVLTWTAPHQTRLAGTWIPEILGPKIQSFTVPAAWPFTVGGLVRCLARYHRFAYGVDNHDLQRTAP